MFAKQSHTVGRARAGQLFTSEELFGGLNVILVGDFHQFPPVASRASSLLYVPCSPLKILPSKCWGRKLWEQFNIIVGLTTQVLRSPIVYGLNFFDGHDGEMKISERCMSLS